MAIPEYEDIDGEELQGIKDSYENLEMAMDHEYEVNEERGFVDVYGGAKPIGPRVLVGLMQFEGVFISQVMHHSQIHSLENDSFGYRIWFVELPDKYMEQALEGQ